MTPADHDIISHVQHPDRGLLAGTFIADKGSTDFAACEALCDLGLMRRLGTPAFLAPADVVFQITAAGREAADHLSQSEETVQ